MKPARITFSSVAITFVIAVVFYFVAYSWLTKRQTGRGPWQIEFTADAAGAPQLTIHQPQLGISNVSVTFLAETLSSTNGTRTVAFAKPKMEVPFGEVIYDDLMFLPGTVTLDVFGHEVELLPRHLVLNRQPGAWRNNSVHSLAPTNKLSAETRKQIKGGYRK